VLLWVVSASQNQFHANVEARKKLLELVESSVQLRRVAIVFLHHLILDNAKLLSYWAGSVVTLQTMGIVANLSRVFGALLSPEAPPFPPFFFSTPSPLKIQLGGLGLWPQTHFTHFGSQNASRRNIVVIYV